MTNEELKKKIKEILRKRMTELLGSCHTDEIPLTEEGAEAILFYADEFADALIVAGMGDVKDVEAEANRYEMLYKLQNRDMALAERRAHDVEHRAEVAEKAFDLINKENPSCFVPYSCRGLDCIECAKNIFMNKPKKNSRRKGKMTDYRRLTEKNINDVEFCNGCSYNDDFNGCEDGGCDKYFLYFNVYERLRKLEDMIENGRLVDANDVESENAALRERLSRAVELPCKVGDKVYGVGFTDCEDSRTTDEKKKRQIFNVCMKMGGNCEKCKYRRPQIEEFVCTHIQLGYCGIEGKSILIVGDRNENYTANNVFTTSEAAEARLNELKGEKK